MRKIPKILTNGLKLYLIQLRARFRMVSRACDINVDDPRKINELYESDIYQSAIASLEPSKRRKLACPWNGMRRIGSPIDSKIW